jgi:hypothetical protein
VGVTGAGIVEIGTDARCGTVVGGDVGRGDCTVVDVVATVAGTVAAGSGACGALAAMAAGVHCRP